VDSLTRKIRQERLQSDQEEGLVEDEERTNRGNGYRSSNRNALPTCAELLMQAGEASNNDHISFEPDIRLGTAKEPDGSRLLEISIARAWLKLETEYCSVIAGEGLGERPTPHIERGIQIERQSSEVFEILPVDDCTTLNGYIGNGTLFCRVQVDERENCKLKGRLVSFRGDIDATLYEESEETYELVEVSANRKRMIDLVVEKCFGVVGREVLLSEGSLEPDR
ncbi:MAG: hypothetical protein AAF394_16735, partial [Planctomycetota bacterium]